LSSGALHDKCWAKEEKVDKNPLITRNGHNTNNLENAFLTTKIFITLFIGLDEVLPFPFLPPLTFFKCSSKPANLSLCSLLALVTSTGSAGINPIFTNSAETIPILCLEYREFNCLDTD